MRLKNRQFLVFVNFCTFFIENVTIPISKLNTSIFSNEILTQIISDSITFDPLVIHNANEMQQIIQSSQNVMEEAGQSLHLKKIHYDTASSSLFSGIFSGTLSSTTFTILIIVIGALVMHKINLWSCVYRSIPKNSEAVRVEENGTISLHVRRSSGDKGVHRELFDNEKKMF